MILCTEGSVVIAWTRYPGLDLQRGERWLRGLFYGRSCAFQGSSPASGGHMGFTGKLDASAGAWSFRSSGNTLLKYAICQYLGMHLILLFSSPMLLY